jgi:hypothetical protein
LLAFVLSGFNANWISLYGNLHLLPQLLKLDEDLRRMVSHGNLEWLCYLSSTSKLSNILCTFSFNCMIFSFNLFIICKSYATWGWGFQGCQGEVAHLLLKVVKFYWG